MVQKVLELSKTPQSKSVHRQTHRPTGGLFNRDNYDESTISSSICDESTISSIFKDSVP